MRYLKIIILSLLFIIGVAQAEAQFSVQKANREFDALSIKLSTQNLTAKSFEDAIDQLESLRDKAETCQKNAKSNLDKVDQQIKESSTTLDGADKKEVVADALKDQRVDIEYLNQKKSSLTKDKSECGLFVLRANEAITAYQDTLVKLTKSKMLTSSTPVWQTVLANPKAILVSFSHIKKLDLKTKIAKEYNWLFIFIGIVIAAILGWLLRSWSFNALKNLSKDSSTIAKVSTYNIYYYSFYVPITVFAYIFLLYNYGIKWYSSPVSIVISTLASYVVYHVIIKLILNPFPFIYAENTPEHLKLKLKKSLFYRLSVLGAIAIVGAWLYYFLLQKPETELLAQLVHTVLIIILAINMLWIMWTVNKIIPKGILVLLCSVISTFVFITIVIATLAGYYNLSEYILLNLTLSIFGLLGVMALLKVLKLIKWFFNGTNTEWQTKMRRFLGVKPHKSFPEINLLSIVGVIIAWLAYITFVLSAWGRNSKYPDYFINIIVKGYKTQHMSIIPFRILTAVLLFILFCLIGRAITTHIAKKSRAIEEVDTQVAIASISWYIFFAISLLIALFIAGVNFTGLVILAGALSVGIGLGLQDIVNNFFSGIILLLEKPIRAGDRIVVGGTEGFVKKVRIRSTQITTIAKSDVIVPNADFIKQQVTNYMFRDRKWRVSAAVGVVYGSDVQLVKNKLLEVATQHPDVVQDEPDQPLVFFRSFGDSSLNFELWCVITEVNKKFFVESDLNFAINLAFKEAGITIAFPQRDVHLYTHDNNKESLEFKKP